MKSCEACLVLRLRAVYTARGSFTGEAKRNYDCVALAPKCSFCSTTLCFGAEVITLQQ